MANKLTTFAFVPAFFILLMIPSSAFCQDNSYSTIDREWHGLNLHFFDRTEHGLADHPYFKAIKARIDGDFAREITELNKAIGAMAGDSLQDRLVKDTYSQLLNYGLVEEAKAFSGRYQLEADTMSLAFKQVDYPEVSIAMPDNRVELPFDQFYFRATVNGTDTVTVFFDTGAPGVAISQELVDRYGWQTDTLYSGTSSLPALGMTFKNYPVLIPELKIGSMTIKNLFAKYSKLTEEEESTLKSKGLDKHDILIGLNVFRDLIDGVVFDYPKGEIRFIKELEADSAPPNFCFVGETPAISYRWNGKKENAYLDTGSPRHVMPKRQLAEGKAEFAREATYGNFTYRIYEAKYDQVLNLKNAVFETADYGFSVNPDFAIRTLFGSFKEHVLFFDLRNRRDSLK